MYTPLRISDVKGQHIPFTLCKPPLSSPSASTLEAKLPMTTIEARATLIPAQFVKSRYCAEVICLEARHAVSVQGAAGVLELARMTCTGMC